MCLGSSSSRSKRAETDIFEPSLEGLGLTHDFRGMLTGPEAFFECVWATALCLNLRKKKSLCHTRLVGGTNSVASLSLEEKLDLFPHPATWGLRPHH